MCRGNQMQNALLGAEGFDLRMLEPGANESCCCGNPEVGGYDGMPCVALESASNQAYVTYS